MNEAKKIIYKTGLKQLKGVSNDFSNKHEGNNGTTDKRQ